MFLPTKMLYRILMQKDAIFIDMNVWNDLGDAKLHMSH